ncbi:MAG: TetR/AcrR family transcriptional regulator [Janthinobacterium lividum]
MARITLAQILDTACRLFAQRGIQAVTTAHVAQAAQISVGSLFRYVATKDELLRAAVDHAQWQLCLGIVAGPDFPRDTVYDTVRRIWEATAARALAAPSLFHYWVLAGATPGVGRQDYSQPRLLVFRGAERLLGQALGTLTRGPLLAHTLEAQWVATVQFALWHQAQETGPGPVSLLAQGYANWWAGVGLSRDLPMPA